MGFLEVRHGPNLTLPLVSDRVELEGVPVGERGGDFVDVRAAHFDVEFVAADGVAAGVAGVLALGSVGTEVTTDEFPQGVKL